MKRILVALVMCLPLPAFAEGRIHITADNCGKIFRNEAADLCQELAAQTDAFTIMDYNDPPGRYDDPYYVRILTKPDLDGRGVRLESTAWAESADAALFKAADILDKIRRGEW